MAISFHIAWILNRPLETVKNPDIKNPETCILYSILYTLIINEILIFDYLIDIKLLFYSGMVFAVYCCIELINVEMTNKYKKQIRAFKMRIKHYRAASILAVALFAIGITGAHATTISNIVTVTDTVSGDNVTTWMNNQDGTEIDGTSASRYMGENSETSVWNYSWNLTADPDPFIAGTFTVTNTSTNDQTFDITFGLPISPSFTNGYMTGSLSGSYFDADGDGSAALSLYTWDGLIDGTSQMNLFTIAGPCLGSGCSVTIGEISQGPTLYTGDVNSTIGIHMNFGLSAGDSATFITSFEIVPVPVPAAVWLFASGLLGLVGITRRKARA